MTTLEDLRTWSRAEYDQLVEMGLFDGERLELLNGMVVRMSPQGAEHAHVIRQLTRRLVRAIGDRALVQVQSPLATGAESAPEPDLAVVADADYRTSHPTTAHLVIEVADTSLTRDRDDKTPLYAAAGVGEYWIIDLNARTVEVRRQPTGGGYAQQTTHDEKATLSPSAFPDIQLRLTDLLG